VRSVLCLLFSLCLCLPAAIAQRHSTALSEAEEEAVRDAAADPAARVSVYQGIIETRIKRIQAIVADKRAQGRRDDLRENMDEIAGLVDEFEDNLEEYDRAHRDLRKPLPKLIDATLRWESVLKQPPDDDSYNIVRKLALEAVGDVKSQATEMLPAQVTYFKAHPPSKTANPGGVGYIPNE
jgi:malate synthase